MPFAALTTRLFAGTLLLLCAALPVHAEDAVCDEGRPIMSGLCLDNEATLDSFANVDGGVRTGIAAISQIRVSLTADLGELVGLTDWTARISGFGIYGRQPTPTRIGSLAPVSNIEALSTVRLYEAWLERSFGAWGSIRFGQLAADGEFATLAAAQTLVNGTFGWPVALAGALPSGGPAYPLATPGVRLALGDPEGTTGVRFGIFAGDPGGKYGEETDPQLHNRHGTTFSSPGGIFYMAEGVSGAEPPNGSDGPRPWVLKVGGWYHNGGFNSVRFDQSGLSLGDPASDGVPKRFSNNYGGYAIGEMVLWRGEGGHVAVFARSFAQPGDRNGVSLQLDGGIAWRGPFGRENDTLALGISWTRIGARSRDFDRDLIAFGATRPVRHHETVAELGYDIAVVPDRLSLRPLVQVLFNPAASEPDERRSPERALPDAFVLGLRAVATF